MATEMQSHPRSDGSSLQIYRNGNHKYWVDGGEKNKAPSVTTLISHIDGDGFGAGMGWAMKMARQNDGDLTAAQRIGQASRDEGTHLHNAIHYYIATGGIDEESDLFISWLQAVGDENTWLASEQFVYSSHYLYGGTADALSLHATDTAIWDWKTKNAESYDKYGGGSMKDQAQLAAYAMALREMDSVYVPERGFIAYIMRDQSGVDVVPVDLNKGWKLFLASRSLYNLVREGV